MKISFWGLAQRTLTFTSWLFRAGWRKTLEPERGIGKYFKGLRPIVYEPVGNGSGNDC